MRIVHRRVVHMNNYGSASDACCVHLHQWCTTVRI